MVCPFEQHHFRQIVFLHERGFALFFQVAGKEVMVVPLGEKQGHRVVIFVPFRRLLVEFVVQDFHRDSRGEIVNPLGPFDGLLVAFESGEMLGPRGNFRVSLGNVIRVDGGGCFGFREIDDRPRFELIENPRDGRGPDKTCDVVLVGMGRDDVFEFSIVDIAFLAEEIPDCGGRALAASRVDEDVNVPRFYVNRVTRVFVSEFEERDGKRSGLEFRNGHEARQRGFEFLVGNLVSDLVSAGFRGENRFARNAILRIGRLDFGRHILAVIGGGGAFLVVNGIFRDGVGVRPIQDEGGLGVLFQIEAVSEISPDAKRGEEQNDDQSGDRVLFRGSLRLFSSLGFLCHGHPSLTRVTTKEILGPKGSPFKRGKLRKRGGTYLYFCFFLRQKAREESQRTNRKIAEQTNRNSVTKNPYS